MVRHTGSTEAQLLNDVISGATEHAGITRADLDFTCAGSCDYVAGQAFSFVQNIGSRATNEGYPRTALAKTKQFETLVRTTEARFVRWSGGGD